MVARNGQADLLVNRVSSVFLSLSIKNRTHGQEIEIGGRKGEVLGEDDLSVVQTSLERRFIGTANSEMPFQVVFLRA